MMKRTPLVAGLASLALFVAACSDDDGDTTTETTAAEESSDTTAAPTDETGGEEEAAQDIVAIASSNDDFSTLVAAVQAADLVETLQGEGPFTVFAPTNEAFAALPEGVLDALLLPENKDVLAQILTYHVVSGAVFAADVTAGEVPTVEGSSITVTTDGGVVLNGSANVVTTDIEASNGVIHVIDAVILPPGVDPAALL